MLQKVLWIVAALAVVAGAGLTTAALAGARKWDAASAASVEGLLRAAPPAPEAVYSPAELEGLPAPVRRYFEFALTPGQPLIQRARLRHEGVFRMKPGGSDMPFVSTQHFTMHRPGFVWDARIGSAPVIIRVRDSYVAGRGSMRAKVASLVTVADVEDQPHMNAGSFHRWVLEAAWYPTALLPSQGVRWEALTDSSARAYVSDGELTLAMDITFADDGRIVHVLADRLRDVDGTGVITPFEAVVGDYQRVAGMMIPREGEVAWLLPEGRHPFWRARITDVEYDFGDAPAARAVMR